MNPPPPRRPDDTGEFRIFDIIENEIKSLREEVKGQRELITQLRIDVRALHVKSGIWGALAGMLPAMGMAILWAVSRT